MTNLEQMILDTVAVHKLRRSSADALVKRWVALFPGLERTRVPASVLPLTWSGPQARACELSIAAWSGDEPVPVGDEHVPVVKLVLRGGEALLRGGILPTWEVQLTPAGLATFLQGAEHEPRRLDCARDAVETLAHLIAELPSQG